MVSPPPPPNLKPLQMLFYSVEFKYNKSDKTEVEHKIEKKNKQMLKVIFSKITFFIAETYYITSNTDGYKNSNDVYYTNRNLNIKINFFSREAEICISGSLQIQIYNIIFFRFLEIIKLSS